MKFFTAPNIRMIDRFTIEKEPIPSILLMERAARTLTSWIKSHFPIKHRLFIFCGTGNNGGDGLAMARMLSEYKYEVFACYLQSGTTATPDNASNLEKIKTSKARLIIINNVADIPELGKYDLIVDAVFGTGLSRPVEGLPAEVISMLNNKNNTRIAIDIPSGLFAENNSENNMNHVFKAHYTLSLQFPKLAFFFAENHPFVAKWHILPIGLHPEAIATTASPFNLVEYKDVAAMITPREKFSHKGTYGHALLIAGSQGMMGAAILSATACLKTGAGLVTAHIPKSGYEILQTSLPEAIVSIDPSTEEFTSIPELTHYNCIGIGPGIGKSKESALGLKSLLKNISKKPLIIDADGLNLLAAEKELLELLPENTILTPHPKEFERLFGPTTSSYQRMKLQQEMAVRHKIIIILKGAHTCIADSEGFLYFNISGNSSMAKGGSGDVLTGIILGLLAQGYSPKDAAIAGVCIHGIAGDLAKNELHENAVLASDINHSIYKAFNHLNCCNHE